MLVDKGIALIHGEIDYNVNETCMSLLVIKDGVIFNDDKKKNPIHLLLCLAAKDNYSHNKALNDFLEIINDFKINKNKYFDKKYIIAKIKEVSM